MANLIILVGIPGSGKSTWVHNLFVRGFHYHSVSSDAIREEPKFGGNVYDQTRNADVFQEFHRRIDEHLKHNVDTIADATSLSRDARDVLRAIAKKNNAEVHMIYFSNLDQAVMRNKRRERIVPDEAMDWMLQKYERFRLELPQEAIHYSSVTEIRSVG